MAVKKTNAKRLSLGAKNSSTFLMLALLLVAVIFLLIAFGPFSADNLGLLSKRQEKQQSEAATILPPDGGSSKRLAPCKFKPSVNSFIELPYGDLDRDGYVTSADALKVQRIVARIEPSPAPYDAIGFYKYEMADVNLSNPRVSQLNDVDATDAQFILRYAARLINTFPACVGSNGTVILK